MNGGITPDSKPKLPMTEVNRLLNLHDVQESVALLGIRAYRRDTMGRTGVNDVGIYDDAIFLRWPGAMLACNANCDPSRIGWNGSIGKPFAQLKTGVWPFIKGKHRGEYDALRQPYEEQAGALGLPDHGHFTVIRDDGKGHRYEDSGYHAINIHHGSIYGTSSWGCQTIPPREWPDFISAVYREMANAHQRWVPYCLIDGPVV